MANSTSDQDFDIDGHLHIERGILAEERAELVSVLEPLSGRLRVLDRESLKIEAWVKNRGERGQVAYASIHAKDTDIAAHDTSFILAAAFVQIRHDLQRQLSDLHDRRTDRRP